MEHSAGPVTIKERIFDLDVIRGIALLGIFIMNMPFFGMSFFSGIDGTHAFPAWYDRTAETARDILFSGKFNSMFSMLFAIGFTIQMGRIEAREPGSARRIYLRRVTWLLVFGAIHACIFWPGDILHMYALFGFLLLAIRRIPEKLLWTIVGLCILFPAVFGIVQYLTYDPKEMAKAMVMVHQWLDSNNAAYGHGNFIDAARESTRFMIFTYTNPQSLMYMAGSYAQILTTMLIGLSLGRRRFFADTGTQLALVRRIQWWALGVGLTAGLYFGLWGAFDKNPLVPSVGGVLAAICYVVSRVATMAFYVTTIIRGIHSPAWRKLLEPFATIGRMPLSNYLFQTLMGTFIFYHWGLGFWGKAGPLVDLILAPVLYFAIQMPLSRWWLARFELGPMEYLWRRLTYGHAQLRRVAPSSVSA